MSVSGFGVATLAEPSDAHCGRSVQGVQDGQVLLGEAQRGGGDVLGELLGVAGTGRTDDQHRPSAGPERQLLHHEAGFDGLPEADVVGDEQVCARHGQCPDHGVELIVGDAHA